MNAASAAKALKKGVKTKHTTLQNFIKLHSFACLSEGLRTKTRHKFLNTHRCLWRVAPQKRKKKLEIKTLTLSFYTVTFR